MWTRRTFLEALSTGSVATRHATAGLPSLLNRRDPWAHYEENPDRLEQYITENAVAL